MDIQPDCSIASIPKKGSPPKNIATTKILGYYVLTPKLTLSIDREPNLLHSYKTRINA